MSERVECLQLRPGDEMRVQGEWLTVTALQRSTETIDGLVQPRLVLKTDASVGEPYELRSLNDEPVQYQPTRAFVVVPGRKVLARLAPRPEQDEDA